jgi:hypothetical protein
MSAPAIVYMDEVSDLPPRVPEGEYRMAMTAYQTAMPFGKDQPRLFMDFKIQDYGPHFGVTLRKFYNVASLTSKAGRHGKCKHKARGDFLIDYCTLFPEQKIKRLDRIPMEPFSKSIIIGKVRDVTKNPQHRTLPAQLRYSVIGELLRVDKQ